jgi:hypothetical protein
MSARGRKRRPPAIVVHSLAQAVAALEAAAQTRRAVELWSAAGAAAYAGAGWFKAVIDEARVAVPKVEFEAVLDCAELAGLVLGAWRIGLVSVCFTGEARAAKKLAQIASRNGRQLHRRRPADALDLHRAADPQALCRAWLAGDGARVGRQ